MIRISIIGGSGYAGSHIASEAVARGHAVRTYSRHAPDQAVLGAEHITADVLSHGTLHTVADDADVIVSALSPRGALAGRTRAVLAELAELATQQGIRLAVIGGAGTLQMSEDGSLVKDDPHFPAEFKAEADEMGAVLDDLRAAPGKLDWFYVSPAGGFGSWAPGTATGTYRVGGDQLLLDESGESNISGSDLAHAVLDEIENPEHRRQRFTVAY